MSVELNLRQCRKIFNQLDPENSVRDMIVKEHLLGLYSESSLTSNKAYSWKDLVDSNYRVDGYYIDDENGCVNEISNLSLVMAEDDESMGIYETKDQCSAFGDAAAKLSHCMKMTNGDWKADLNLSQKKYVIEHALGGLNVCYSVSTKQFLSFPTQEVAEEFLDANKDLIIQYFNGM